MEIYYLLAAIVFDDYARVMEMCTRHDRDKWLGYACGCGDLAIKYRGKRLVRSKCDRKDCDCICAGGYLRTLSLLELRDILYTSRTSTVSRIVGCDNAYLSRKLSYVAKNIDFVIARIENDLRELDHDELRNSIDIMPKYSELLARHHELEAKHERLMAAFKSISE